MSSPTDPHLQRQRPTEKEKADLSLAAVDIKRNPENPEQPQQAKPGKTGAEQLASTSFQHGVERKPASEKIEGRIERIHKPPRLSGEVDPRTAKASRESPAVVIHTYHESVDVLQRLMNWIANMLKRLDRSIFSRKKGTNEEKIPLPVQPVKKKKSGVVSPKGEAESEEESSEELTIQKQAPSPELEEWLEQQNPDKSGANTTKRS